METHIKYLVEDSGIKTITPNNALYSLTPLDAPIFESFIDALLFFNNRLLRSVLTVFFVLLSGCLPQGSQPLVEVSPEQEEVQSSPAQATASESQSTPTPAAPLVWQVVPLFTNAFTHFSPQNEQTEYRCYYKNSETYFSMTFYGHESGGYGHDGWIRLPGQDRRSMNWNNKLSSLRLWISRSTSEQPFAGLAAAEIKDITYQPVVNGSRGDILSGGRIEFEANQNTDFYTYPLEFEDCFIRPFTY